jgi:hypothetical protein
VHAKTEGMSEHYYNLPVLYVLFMCALFLFIPLIRAYDLSAFLLVIIFLRF